MPTSGERDSTGGKSQSKQTLDRPTKCKQITVLAEFCYIKFKNI